MKHVCGVETIMNIANHMRSHPDHWKYNERDDDITVYNKNEQFTIRYEKHWYGYIDKRLEFRDNSGQYRVMLGRVAFKPLISAIRFMQDWHENKQSRDIAERVLLATRDLTIKSDMNIT